VKPCIVIPLEKIWESYAVQEVVRPLLVKKHGHGCIGTSMTRHDTPTHNKL